MKKLGRKKHLHAPHKTKREREKLFEKTMKLLKNRVFQAKKFLNSKKSIFLQAKKHLKIQRN
jgi:hypothetical protein